MNRNWNSLRPVLQQILYSEVANGNEAACQLCIIDHGEVVIDLAAGFRADGVTPCSTDDLFPVFSSGKPFLAALAWVLAENDIICFSDPVGKYWKEFSAPDKAGITIEHLLSHRAGMYLLPSGKPDLTDWEKMCSLIAAMPPRNLPGKKCHYHPLTFAWLLGHTLELATGFPLQYLLNKYVLQIAGVENSVFFGIPQNQMPRIIPIDDSRIPNRPSWEAVTMNDPAIQACCIPSFNGIANAAGLAEFYRQLPENIVSPETFDFATGKLFRSPDDPVKNNEWSRFALGVVLRGPDHNRRMFIGHGGAAGSEAFYMPDEKIAFAFTKNRLSPNHPDHPVRDLISHALEVPTRFW
ncbi:MAG: beta-lactamase family protein [Lentisphaeria bacterium]|nr:beta-lactamase family protein [Lentisphaeria bacterium]